MGARHRCKRWLCQRGFVHMAEGGNGCGLSLSCDDTSVCDASLADDGGGKACEVRVGS